LVRKYSSSHYGMVAVTLDEFMTRQAAIARRQMPLTPPDEETCSTHLQVKDQRQGSNQSASNGVPMTPQKDTTSSQMPPHGYLTPPETPNGDYFDYTNAETAKLCPSGPYRPITPILTPNSSFSGHTYYAQ